MTILNSHQKMEKKDMFGNTNLHLAAYKGDTISVYKLVNNGANIESVNYEGYTPLMSTIYNDNVKAYTLLLKKGAHIFHEDIKGYSISNLIQLHNSYKIACSTLNMTENIFQYLIKNNKLSDMVSYWIKEQIVLYNTNDEIYQTYDYYYGSRTRTRTMTMDDLASFERINDNVILLLKLIKANKFDLFQKFFEFNMTKNKHVKEWDILKLFSFAMKMKATNIVDYFFNYLGSNITEEYVFRSALHYGYDNIVLAILKSVGRKALENIWKKDPYDYMFDEAYQTQNIKKIKYLIKNGFQFNKLEDEDYLYMAIKNDYNEIAKILIENDFPLDYYCNVDEDGGSSWINKKILYKSTLMHIAVEKNNVEIMQLLFDRGFKIKGKNSTNTKPIHLALYNSNLGAINLEAINCLCRNKAIPSVQDYNKKIPLQIALEYFNSECVKALLTFMSKKDLLKSVKICIKEYKEQNFKAAINYLENILLELKIDDCIHLFI